MDEPVVELLDGAVVVRTSAGRVRVSGQVAPLLIATLAMKTPRPVPWEILGTKTGQTKTTLAKSISRLRDLQLDIEHGSAGYFLRLDPSLIDARRLMAVAGRSRSELTYEDVVDTLALWGSGPPDLRDPQLWRELLAAHDALEKLRRQLAPRRLLIVEDQVGDRLCQVLGRYECHVVRDLGAFWEIHDDLDGRFDAALVDMNLSPAYQDRDGEQVLETISRSRSNLPVIVMTAMMPKGFDVAPYLRRYNLAGFVTKLDDNQDSDFSAIANAVHELFDGDVTTVLCERLEDELPRIGRRARKWLEKQGRRDELPRMRIEHQRLFDTAQRGDLADLRAEVAAFETKYGSPGAGR